MNAPSTLPIRHAGINLGYGHVKIKTSTQYLQYASLARPALVADKVEVAGFTAAKVQRIELNGQTWLVGAEAALSGDRATDRTSFSNWGSSEVYAALRQSILDRLAEESLGPWVLMLGMPVDQFQDEGYRRQLIGSWRRSHTTIHGALQIEQVAATPEPLGAFWEYALSVNDSFARVQQSEVLIVDMGHFTTDLSVVNRMVLNTQMGGSKATGMRDVYRGLAEHLRSHHAVRYSQLEVEMAALQQWPIRVRGNPLDLTEELNAVAHPVIADLIRWLRSQVDFARGLVLVAGGGAPLLTGALREAYPSAEIVLMPHPQQANARGYFRMAQQLRDAATVL